ncbi:hypothetical protein [Roseomonas genomospecies 6]|nr:hypothetical protein [Roseomonas genomospecies 6]
MSIALVPELGERLRKLANRQGIAITALIERMVEREEADFADEIVSNGGLPNGWTVEALAVEKERIILFGGEGLPLTALTLPEATLLSAALNAAAEENKTTILPKTDRGKRLIEVKRQGRGVVASIDGIRRSMTPVFAAHLAVYMDIQIDHAPTLEDGVAAPAEPPTEGRALELWNALQR